ncbi:hypothetical protein QJS04_geneDACA023042 [Acorus gramineus]|uniref:Uncharacterized protein n=1 Tax=Acorus gramineus TaxID=55184 RepID=A0AAV9A903_ACOGR|nr:hypothetical protein QJS04_geneDACA023042 [Acorus gramineus]
MIAVADAGYRAIAPDFRGYGLSQAPPEEEEASWSSLVADLLGILDSLSLSKVRPRLEPIIKLITKPHFNRMVEIPSL